MIGIIDYGLGNLQSVQNALASLELTSEIIDDPSQAEGHDRLILPGVGAFGHAMTNLRKKQWETFLRAWAEDQKPLLGICLGMQLLGERGLEFGDNEGLGLIPGLISLLETEKVVPHMGWNSLIDIRLEHPVLSQLKEGDDVYFVHSYAFRTEPGNVLAWCDYGEKFPAIVGSGSVIGTQFHPEKSQVPGLSILKAFASWQPGASQA